MKDKELDYLRSLYRQYMNEQIPPPSHGDYNSNFRTDRDGF